MRARSGSTMESNQAPEPLIRVAYVKKPHGIRGALRLELLGDDVTRLHSGLTLHIENTSRTLTIEHADPQANGDVIVTLKGIADRNAAELLRNVYFVVPMSKARRLNSDEWFVHDLIGLKVVDETGAVRGTVEDIEHYTGNDVVVVRQDNQQYCRFPLVKSNVSTIDLKLQCMQVSSSVFEEFSDTAMSDEESR